MRRRTRHTRAGLGRRGEQAAASYLRSRGMEVIASNWRCPAGEIDILARDGKVLVVCEVKTRSSRRCGAPEEALTHAKRRRLVRLGGFAWLEYPAHDGIRFDVVAIDVAEDGRALLRHHRAAFQSGVD